MQNEWDYMIIIDNEWIYNIFIYIDTHTISSLTADISSCIIQYNDTYWLACVILTNIYLDQGNVEIKSIIISLEYKYCYSGFFH